MDKKYQIFISSTYVDLREARIKVRDAILSIYNFPVGMEMFGAANEEQWQIISETIDSSDYYVLIVGQRYGSVIQDGPDSGISYTEKEFRYACNKGIPILAFLLDDSVPVKPEYVEKDNPDKLQAFKQSVMNGRLIERWSSPDDLAQKVTAALHKQILRTKRPGWIRGDSVDIEKNLSELVELSRQNRELQEENKRLSVELEKIRAVNARKPKLTITLEVADSDGEQLQKNVDYMSIDEDGTVHIKLIPISTVEKEVEYEKLSMGDVPPELRRFTSAAEIKEYNDALPSQDAIDKYLLQYELYRRIMENGIASTFSVGNVGEAKATDVSVTISFPQGLLVLDEDEVKKLQEPNEPEKPRSPIEIAYYKAQREKAMALDNPLPKAVGSGYSGFDYRTVVKAMTFPRINSVLHSVEIKNNTIEIKTNSIVHSKSHQFDGAIIVPLTTGKFEATAKFMCTEYLEPEERVIKFCVDE